MFTIQKKHKVQAFYYYHNPSNHEISEQIEHISEWAEIASTYLQKIFWLKINSILDNNSLEEELTSLWIVELKDYFLEFPSAWEDLKRKMSTHRDEKEWVKGKYVLSGEKEDFILPVFLRLGRKDNMWNTLEALFREEILSNPALLQLSSREPSILDTSHENLRFLDEKKRIPFLEHMIYHGLQQNTDERIEDYSSIMLLLPDLLIYLKSIFDIEFSDMPKKIKSAKDIAKFLVQKIWNWENNWLESKKSWLLVKAFNAWWGYTEISNHRKQAEANIKEVPSMLQKLWIRLLTDNNSLKKDTDNIGRYTCAFTTKNWDDISFELEFRIKSMRSILLKLWESEDYNNFDALRDIFGMAIIFPDHTPDELKEEIVLKFSQIMTNKWYLIKNKWLLWEKSLKRLKNKLKNEDKKALWKIVSSTKWKTSNKFKNTSISWFSKIFWDPLWMEIQFHEESSYKYWMDDHHLYDPLKIVSAWWRGSWFVTPNQLLHIVRKEIPENIRETIIKKLPQQIILDYLNTWRILAFKWEKWDIYFSALWQVEKFKEKFPKASHIEKWDKEMTNFITWITI